MELKDFIVTPIVLLIVYVVAYLIRPRVTDINTKRYFIPALTLKIIGAIAVGIIYQFYYGGGDTFNYHTHGSRHIWEAFNDDIFKGLQLLFSDGDYQPSTFEYASKILFFKDSSSFFMVRIVSVVDLFTFHTYSATSIIITFYSFIGLWSLFYVFYHQDRNLHLPIAICVFFIPSIFFWGSGILKDSITLGSLGFLLSAVYNLFVRGHKSIKMLFLLIFATFILFSLKKYILLSFIPAAVIWIFLTNYNRVKSFKARVILLPISVVAVCLSGYLLITVLLIGDSKYSLEKLPETAMITAYDIRYWSGRDAGSGYSLGELDGTYQSMFRLAPQAVNVALFRPYPWEVNNILMAISSLESSLILIYTVIVIFYRASFNFLKFNLSPFVLFCLIFSLTFAFAVGISTYNFGTLVRYKIPLVPFYLVSLIYLSNSHHTRKHFDKI